MDTNYISEEEKQVCEFLKNEGQEHLISNLSKFSNKERQQFVEQIKGFEKTYPGGLAAYIKSARKLLKDSSENVNPYEGYTPSVPAGQSVDFYKVDELNQLESAGLEEIKYACFVLVAGGLGERLGYNSIKIGIPIDVVTNTTFIQYYIEYILAFQKKSGADEIPLAIMVSDDTHFLTEKILQENNYFGMKKDQITIMKQDKVPVFGDITAKMCLKNENTLLLETKPHGHGDVHMLLHMKGLAEKWKNMGKKWVLFFQDTNPLAFRAFPSVFGVNSITIPRKPGEAVGAICKLTNQQGKNLTLNVEYNQLEGLFKEKGGEPVDAQGYSLYPGNINCLIFSLREYCQTLQIHEGRIAEFVNPKYKDSTKTAFTTPTRLECMMQDYPKLLENGDRVGITQIDRRFCFSTVKNDLKSAAGKYKSNLAPESASSCEYDFYWCNGELLRICKATIETINQQQTYAGIGFNIIPKIILKPSFGVTLQEIQSKIKGKMNISAFSTLVVDGDITIENLDLNGSLYASKNLKDVQIQDKNFIQFQEINVTDPNEPSYLAIRGYKVTANVKDIIKM